MASRWPFWKWHCWKSIGFFALTQMVCQWSLDFKAKLELQSGNRKIQYGCQIAILKVTSLKINRLLRIAKEEHAYEIWNSKVNLSYTLETMPSTDRWTDRQTHKVNPVYPPAPTTLLGRGIIIHRIWHFGIQWLSMWLCLHVNADVPCLLRNYYQGKCSII